MKIELPKSHQGHRPDSGALPQMYRCAKAPFYSPRRKDFFRLDWRPSHPDGVGGAFSPVLAYEFDGVGNQITTIDGLGHETAYAFDRANRLTTITEEDPDGDSSLGEPVTTYSYTAAGFLGSLTDPVLNSTSWTTTPSAESPAKRMVLNKGVRSWTKVSGTVVKIPLFGS